MEKEMNYDDYKELLFSLENMDAEKLIDTHKKLRHFFYKNGKNKINYGNMLINDILCFAIDERFDKKVAKEFFESKYISDYFKFNINQYLLTHGVNSKASDILTSPILINDMKEEDLEIIKSAINKANDNYHDLSVENYMQLLYRLSGENVKSFVMKKDNRDRLTNYILRSSGLNERASWYSGRGVNEIDLNENNLTKIFNKLSKYSSEYAINFFELVNIMETLGATDFISSFKLFTANDFQINEAKVSPNNNYDDIEKRLSNRIKRAFLLKNMGIVIAINPEYQRDLKTKEMYDELYRNLEFEEVCEMRSLLR